MKRSKKALIFSIIVIVGVIADQITKLVAVKALENKGFVKVIGDFFGFELVYNPGAFLGMLSTNRWLFMIPSAIAIVLLTVWLFKKESPHPLFSLSVSLFVCGGIGNMIDRIRLEKVIDFISFRFGTWKFPNFNVADSCVTVGAVLFAIYCILTDEKEIFGNSNSKKRKTVSYKARGEDTAEKKEPETETADTDK